MGIRHRPAGRDGAVPGHGDRAQRGPAAGPDDRHHRCRTGWHGGPLHDRPGQPRREPRHPGTARWHHALSRGERARGDARPWRRPRPPGRGRGLRGWSGDRHDHHSDRRGHQRHADGVAPAGDRHVAHVDRLRPAPRGHVPHRPARPRPLDERAHRPGRARRLPARLAGGAGADRQRVRPELHILAAVDKALLSDPAAAYGGVHDRLRQRPARPR